MTQAEYITRRDSLIPGATKRANMGAGAKPKNGEPKDVWSRRWDRSFHRIMDRMAKEAGI